MAERVTCCGFFSEALRKVEVLPGQERENCTEENREVERETLIIIYEAKEASGLRSGGFLQCLLHMFLLQNLSRKVSGREGLREGGVKGGCDLRCTSVGLDVLKREGSGVRAVAAVRADSEP